MIQAERNLPTKEEIAEYAKLGYRFERARIVTCEDGSTITFPDRWVKDIADLAKLQELYPSDVIPEYKKIVKSQYL